jgi:hypothetical protein
VTVVELTVEPDVPVMVTVDVPAGVLAAVLIVRPVITALAPGVTGLVAKAQVAPAGRPVQARVTGIVKPPDGVTVTVEVAELPAAIEAGESAVAATLKLGSTPAGCRKATTCMTHASVLGVWKAVASKGPATSGKVCMTLSAYGV